MGRVAGRGVGNGAVMRKCLAGFILSCKSAYLWKATGHETDEGIDKEREIRKDL